MDWPIFFFAGVILGFAFGLGIAYVWYDDHR